MTKENVKEIVEALVAAQPTYKELRQIATDWLAAYEGGNLHDLTAQLIAGAEACIMPIDNLIAFTASDAGVNVFGSEFAKQLHDHGVAIKAKGAHYCDCPACQECMKLITNKTSILALF